MEPQHTKWKFSRREFIKTGAAGLGVAALGSIPRQVFGQAPAVLKGTRLGFLQGTYFFRAAQDLFRKQAEDWGKMAGVTVVVEFVNWPDVQRMIAAAIQEGGFDIVHLGPAWGYLYKDSLVDLTEETEEVGRRGGGFEPYVLDSARINNRFLGMPVGYTNDVVNYRISWFREAGVANVENGAQLDMTWDEYHAVAKKCKAAGHPFGQALGHSPEDPPNFCYPYMWAHGAMEISKDGKSIAFNTPEFVDAMRRFIQEWKDGYDETGTSWGYSNNKRAFLSGQLAATLNGTSIYSLAKKDFPPIANDMNHMLIPKGPAGRFCFLETMTLGVLKNSKNIAGAKEFLKWWLQDDQFNAWFRAQEGYQLPTVKKQENDPMWFADPKMTVCRDQPKYARNSGYAGPPNDKAAMALSRYLIVDTFAKAVQSEDAKAAVEWGAEQLKRTYGL